MSDEAGGQAWLPNLRAQFVGDGEGGYVLGGGYQVAQTETGGPGAASVVLHLLPAFVVGPAANFAGCQPAPRPILQPVPAAADAVPLVTPAISVSNHSPESGIIGSISIFVYIYIYINIHVYMYICLQEQKDLKY